MTKNYLIEKKIDYAQNNLKYGWSKRNFNISGDYILCFKGSYFSHQLHKECETTGFPFKFEQMIHFIVEHKRIGLREIETRKRLLLEFIASYLGKNFYVEQSVLFFRGKQLSLSFSNSNLRSSMFHLSFFWQESELDPELISLDQFDVDYRGFAIDIMQKYCFEINQIHELSLKT